MLPWIGFRFMSMGSGLRGVLPEHSGKTTRKPAGLACPPPSNLHWTDVQKIASMGEISAPTKVVNGSHDRAPAPSGQLLGPAFRPKMARFTFGRRPAGWEPPGRLQRARLGSAVTLEPRTGMPNSSGRVPRSGGDADNSGARAELRLRWARAFPSGPARLAKLGLSQDGVVDGGASALPWRRTDAAP